MVERGPAARRQAEDRRRRSSPAAGSTGAPSGIPIGDDPQLAGVPLAGRDPVAELGGVEADGRSQPRSRRPRPRRSRRRPRRRCRRRRPARRSGWSPRSRAIAGLPRGALEAGAEDRVDDGARARQPGVEVGGKLVREELQRLDLEAHPRAGAGPRPARRRRCCPCRRGSAPGPAGASPATASASAVPAASISSASGIPCSSIAQRSTARMPSAS